ncbi:FliI/YscN family ATPase [Chromobacterium alticapitis]|uniref:EscN/YscN/HrcN family type III secretion system ATPase n=1 Tax=Chromobacterium alticapitis TaxID=2073169 RepID=A0A2S5DL84_9NEIS|nr:FliI/YscN family ATPase [Chromobacterium alticapitis]POZ63768.1 EscN/YscN/HrcN family type III secretion system ATPase [Chromobacterium alticapitis]
MTARFERLRETIRGAELVERVGHVSRKAGLLVESRGPSGVGLGDLCRIELAQGRGQVLAEVAGLAHERLQLLPYGSLDGLMLGDRVVPAGHGFSVPVGDGLLGRVVDAFCRPLDDKGPVAAVSRRPVRGAPIPALRRSRIDAVMETGVRAIDSMLTIGYGQRLSIMAGSGVGKSTLLGMLVRNCAADVVVVGLIGERGREVLEFLEENLGEAGLARAVVVVATADEPALVREAAALSAVSVAEHFRDQGRSVLLIVDSLTRYAMARREVGLAIGEPATSRGYTPSVFSELAGMLERCGTRKEGGSITGLFTVLVEGDDIHDPVADSVRGIVDGHIVLSRELANAGHFPAIDVLGSVSRLSSTLASEDERRLMKSCRKALSVLAASKDLLELGAYRAGGNPELDQALERKAGLEAFLQQDTQERSERETALARLSALLGGG